MNRIFCLAAYFLAILYSSPAINAQNSVSDFLLTAFESKNLAQYDKADAFLSKKKYRIPPIDELEVRFSNDEFTQEDQQYAFRISPANPWQIRRNNALFNATRKELSIQKQIQHKENIYDRYQLVVEYLFDKKSASIQDQQYSIIQKKVEIIGENAESRLFDSEDLVDAKIDQVDELSNLEDRQISNLRLRRLIAEILQNSDFDWSEFSMISTEKIKEVANSIVTDEFASPEIELISQRIDIVEKEVRLEKADFNIGFAQVEYFPFRDRNSDYGVSFGISLPLFRTNKDQIAELTLDKIELNTELEIEIYKDSVNKVLEYNFLLDLIKQHEQLTEQAELLNIEELTSRLSARENDNPITLLNLKEGLLKIELLKLKSEERLFNQYVEFLDTFNVLAQVPLRNYLTEELENLE